jgi:3',5'-cyclic AMP phosphodiesterase CpdA
MIVHLSDLHFGRVDPAIVEPIIRAVHELRPDVVAVSGDLTQRARRAEFEEARRFLHRLPPHRIVVPGNHDVPLKNPYSRFVSKWARFREYISDEMEPAYQNDAIAIVGVNTARALTWKGGRINPRQIERVRATLCEQPRGVFKIVVVHHPLDLPQSWAGRDRAWRARRAFESWADCGVHMILAGHHHVSFAGVDAEPMRIGAHGAIVVQAGTATSTRGRGEPNSFNSIEVTGSMVRVLRYSWDSRAANFRLAAEQDFARAGSAWQQPLAHGRGSVTV